MGGNSSKEKALHEFPENERYFGFENFGNTCYANSVLQSLYFCRAFRENLLQYQPKLSNDSDDNLLNCLAELFQEVLYSIRKEQLHQRFSRAWMSIHPVVGVGVQLMKGYFVCRSTTRRRRQV